jgi:hypothetical protein
LIALPPKQRSYQQVEKLHKKHNKEDVVVIEKMQNGKLVVTQGDIQNVKGEYKVHIIGHGSGSWRSFCLFVIFCCMLLAVSSFDIYDNINEKIR